MYSNLIKDSYKQSDRGAEKHRLFKSNLFRYEMDKISLLQFEATHWNQINILIVKNFLVDSQFKKIQCTHFVKSIKSFFSVYEETQNMRNSSKNLYFIQKEIKNEL